LPESSFSNKLVQPVNKTFGGVGVRNIIFGLVISANGAAAGRILGEPQGAVSTFPNCKWFSRHWKIFGSKNRV